MSSVTEWTNRNIAPVVLVLSCILLVILSLFHIYTKYSQSQNDSEPDSDQSTIHRLVYRLIPLSEYSAMFCFAGNAFSLIPIYYRSVNSDNVCVILATLTVTMWPMAKLSMFSLWLCKIYSAFSQSVYAYNHRWFIGGIVIWFIAILILAYSMTQVSAYYDATQAFVCVASYPIWGIILTSVSDAIVSLLCVTMFIRPLFRILSESEHNNQSLDLLLLAQKYALLTTIAVITSLIGGILLVMTGIAIFYQIDAVINVACILLMSPLHQKRYQWLCTPAENCFCHRCKLMSGLKKLHGGLSSVGPSGRPSARRSVSDVAMADVGTTDPK